MTESPDTRSVMTELQAGALAAICALARPHGDPREDPNPVTHELEIYDLARLFNPDPARRSGVAVTLEDVATVVRGTLGPADRRARRARWVAAELTLLGYEVEAATFAALAEEQPSF
jgi:hypothetical protein